MMRPSTKNSGHDPDEKSPYTEPLRVGLLLDLSALRPWQRRLAEQIEANSSLRLCRLFNAPDTAVAKPSLASKLLHLVERFECKVFLPGRFLNTEQPARLPLQADIFEISPDIVRSADAAQAMSELDVVVSLVPIGGPFARSIAEHVPLWATARTKVTDISDPHLGFHDMFNKDGISSLTVLEVFLDGTAHIAESIVQLQFCYARNKCFLQEKSVPIILRELRLRASQTGGHYSSANLEPDSTGQQISFADVAGYAMQLVSNLAPKIYKALLRKTGRRYNRWSLFVGMGDFDPQRMSQAQETHPPANEFWADPFLFRAPDDRDMLVFFENFKFSTRLGKISVGRLDGDKIAYVGDALVRPYHLSYPFVYAYDGGIYMIPETAQNRQIEIWKAVDYPLNWTLLKTVLEGESCADTTIFEHDGAWWMFTSISTDSFDDHCSELHVFKVDSPLLNEIEPHKLNPVITDARAARNAGRIAVRGGKLTRLAQNNAKHYGYAFSLMEIERLTLQDYYERCLYEAVPGFMRGISSTHHMDQLDDVHIFDGQRPFG